MRHGTAHAFKFIITDEVRDSARIPCRRAVGSLQAALGPVLKPSRCRLHCVSERVWLQTALHRTLKLSLISHLQEISLVDAMARRYAKNGCRRRRSRGALEDSTHSHTHTSSKKEAAALFCLGVNDRSTEDRRGGSAPIL